MMFAVFAIKLTSLPSNYIPLYAQKQYNVKNFWRDVHELSCYEQETIIHFNERVMAGKATKHISSVRFTS